MLPFADAEPLGADEALELVGPDCLAYVTHARADDIRARAEQRTQLEPRQEQALAAVLALLGSPLVRSPRESESRRSSAVSSLTMFVDGVGTTVANALRVQAGGELPEIAAGDPVEEAAAHLARDSFVALLVPRSEPFHGGPLSEAGMFRNPWSTRFQEAILADSELGQHFTGPPDSGASSFPFRSTTGYGEGGVQLALLADRILSTPAAMCRARQASPGEFVAAAFRAVSDLRRLVVDRRTVRASALLGFDAITVPSNTAVDTPWGRLRSQTPGERELIGPYAGSGNAVVEAEYPVKLFVGDDAKFGTVDNPAIDAFLNARAELEERARMVALAVLLALDVPLPAGLGLRYTLIEDPFGGSPALSGHRFAAAERR